MTTDDLEAAHALARRVVSDGQWHVSDAFQSIVRDDRRNLVCITDGDLFGGRDFERDAEDIVAARRLVPVLIGEVERLRAELEMDDPSEELDRAPLIVGEPLRCECCGEIIRAGEQAATSTEYVGRCVVMHWGLCPSPATWVVHWRGWDPNEQRDYEGRDTPRTLEEAFVIANRRRALPDIQRVWLKRFAHAGRCSEIIDRAVPHGVECTYRKEPCGRAVVSGGRCERHPEVRRG